MSDLYSIQIMEAGLADCSNYELVNNCAQQANRFDCKNTNGKYDAFIQVNSEVNSYKLGKQNCPFLGEKVCFGTDNVTIYCTNGFVQEEKGLVAVRIMFSNGRSFYANLSKFPDLFSNGNKIMYSSKGEKLFELKINSANSKEIIYYENTLNIQLTKSKFYTLMVKGYHRMFSQSYGLLYDSSFLKCTT